MTLTSSRTRALISNTLLRVWDTAAFSDTQSKNNQSIPEQAEMSIKTFYLVTNLYLSTMLDTGLCSMQVCKNFYCLTVPRKHQYYWTNYNVYWSKRTCTALITNSHKNIKLPLLYVRFKLFFFGWHCNYWHFFSFSRSIFRTFKVGRLFFFQVSALLFPHAISCQIFQHIYHSKT